jgi:two-component system, cell cycle response regulator DivK
MNCPDYTRNTFLIVEDDPISAMYLKDMLDDTGAKVIHVANASDAIYTAHENKEIDVILMDIQLPDMSGWQATRIIKKVKKDLPIIIQSAYAFESYIKKSQEAGCDFFIAKPVESDMLFEYINKVLEMYHR